MNRQLSPYRFVREWDHFADSVFALAQEKGWYDNGKRNPAEAIALIHSELSEALEALRTDPNQPDKHVPQMKNVEVELADAVIRIMDLSRAEGWDVGYAIVQKYLANRARPPRHGKRF